MKQQNYMVLLGALAALAFHGYHHFEPVWKWGGRGAVTHAIDQQIAPKCMGDKGCVDALHAGIDPCFNETITGAEDTTNQSVLIQFYDCVVTRSGYKAKMYPRRPAGQKTAAPRDQAH